MPTHSSEPICQAVTRASGAVPVACQTHCTLGRSLRRRAAAVAIGVAALVASGSVAQAQLPGLPVLQSGFTRAGAGVAVNYGSESRLSTVALAGAWSAAGARWQLSGGLGVAMPDTGGTGTGAGIRAAMPIPTPWTGPDASLGVTGFVGAGGAWRSGGGEIVVPIGLGLGYRRAIGTARALAVYLTPYFAWVRATGDGLVPTDGVAVTAADTGPTVDSSLFRSAVGVDALVTSRIGATFGYDFGMTADPGHPGPTGGTWGVGLSWGF